jgi:FkbM family methyltransferase
VPLPFAPADPRARLRAIARAALSHTPARLVRLVGRLQFRSSLLRALVGRATRSMRVGEIVVRHGAAAGLVFDPHGANPGYGLGTSEPVIQELLGSLLAPGAVFFDIGANVGFFSVIAARMVGPTGTVVAFEPLPANVVGLRANAARNGMDQVRVIAAAVGDRAATVALQVTSDPTHARLREVRERDDAIDELEVPMVTVDELVDAGVIPPPTVIKLDVEGAEVAALRGMTGTLRRHRPTVVCELHGTNRQVGAVLRDSGYVVEVVGDDQQPIESAPWWAHVLATPAGPPESERPAATSL